MECVKIFSSWKVRRWYAPEDWPILLQRPASISIPYNNYRLKSKKNAKAKGALRSLCMCALHPWLFLAIPFSDFGYNSREISRKTRETTHTLKSEKKQINRNTEAAVVNIRAGHHMLFSRIGSLNHIARTHTRTFFCCLFSPLIHLLNAPMMKMSTYKTVHFSRGKKIRLTIVTVTIEWNVWLVQFKFN